MRDLLDILTAAARLDGAAPAVLVTVVRVEGSSYRLPGARMLIDAAGTRTGSVSGGCLEADVARRGRLLSDGESATLVRYDGSDEDAAWGFGLGCNGSIEVFIERLAGPASDTLAFLRRCVEQRRHGVLVTVFRVNGQAEFISTNEAPPTPGLRYSEDPDQPRQNPGLRRTSDPASVLLQPGQRWTCDDGDASQIPAPFRSVALRCLAGGATTTVICETIHGRAHALVEAIHPPVPLVIFGAGHDAVPLVRAAKQLGWHVTVCDRRPGYARPDRFPLADTVIAADLHEIFDRVRLTADTVAVTMSHHYPDDRVALEMLLRSPARYVGALGPLARTQRMLAECAADGFHPSPQQLARLHAPVGLDLGAEGPDQVALAIVAEIVAVLNQRDGAFLRRRQGPIHDPAPTHVVVPSATGCVEVRR